MSSPYNQLWQVMPISRTMTVVDRQWMAQAAPTEDNIIIVDPDCMFVKKMDIMVEEGSPIAQQAFYNFDFDEDDVDTVGRGVAKVYILDPLPFPSSSPPRYCQNCPSLAGKDPGNSTRPRQVAARLDQYIGESSGTALDGRDVWLCVCCVRVRHTARDLGLAECPPSSQATCHTNHTLSRGGAAGTAGQWQANVVEACGERRI